MTITRSDETIDERFLEFAGDSMTIYEGVQVGPGIEKGDVLGSYSRVG